MLRRQMSALLFVSAVCDMVTVETDGEAALSKQETLCAIGDLHGDEQHALRALRLCNAVNEEGLWTGGRMTVVQTGDVLDRGNASVPLLDRLWALQKEASAAGGELVLLLGNHELLNLQGRLKYVAPAELHAFGGGEQWRRAFDPNNGHLGKRIAAHDGATTRGSAGCRTLFMHAGLRAKMAQKYGSLETLNAALRVQLLRNRGELLDVTEGPLWYRGYARQVSEETACAELQTTLETIGDGAVRMAVGHNVSATIQTHGHERPIDPTRTLSVTQGAPHCLQIMPFIASRCHGALQLIDVGMSSAYGGQPAAWRCTIDASTSQPVVRALYEGEDASEPPELCTACSTIRGGPRQRLSRVMGWAAAEEGISARRSDPHGDCSNYC